MSAPTITARGHRMGERPTADGGPRHARVGVWVAVVVVALLLTGLAVQLTTPRTSSLPLSPDNPEPDGGRAAAQVLAEHGVDVVFVTTTAAAVAEAEAGSTLLVIDPDKLRDVQLEAIADVEADMVLTGLGSSTDLSALTDRITVSGYASPTGTVTAGCSDPDAQAAGQITRGGALVEGDDVTTCFATSEGAGYAAWTEGDRTWRVIGQDAILTNAGLPLEGNAALVFRSLGAHDRLVWYLPDPDDSFGLETPMDLFPLPGPVILQLALVGLVLVLWRGRRLGAVVVEPLPVVVKASETTRGRGRLYRRAGAHAHAAASLRAGLVARVAGRVGLATHAGPDEVVATLAGASGRPPEAVRDVLYGPPPTTDDGLIALTQALDTLESEVQRG